MAKAFLILLKNMMCKNCKNTDCLEVLDNGLCVACDCFEIHNSIHLDYKNQYKILAKRLQIKYSKISDCNKFYSFCAKNTLTSLQLNGLNFLILDYEQNKYYYEHGTEAPIQNQLSFDFSFFL